MAISVERLRNTFAVEIKGANLASPLSDSEFGTIHDAWLDNKVILIRDQVLDEEDIVRFGRRFGELEIHVRNDAGSRLHPEILLVTNKKENGRSLGVLGDAEANWHVDQIYMRQPTFGTMLYGVEIPPQGGNTSIFDLATLYQRLPGGLRQRIDGRRAVNSARYYNETYAGGMSVEQLKRVPDVVHPLVRTHPIRGWRSLFFSFNHTASIEGCGADESRSLIDELKGVIKANPDLVYEHRWRPGDVLMWDNTSTMHRRDSFDGAHHSRLLKRVSFKYPAEFRIPT